MSEELLARIAQLEINLAGQNKIRQTDSIVDSFLDLNNRHDPRKVFPKGLRELADAMAVDHLFFHYLNPRTFDFTRKQDRTTTILSSGADDEKYSLIKKLDDYEKEVVAVQGVNSLPLKGGLFGYNLLSIPIFGGHNKEYVGMIGSLSKRESSTLDLLMLSQASSRLDVYIRDKILQSERHRIIRIGSQALGKEGLAGITDALKLFVEFTDTEKATVVYLEDELTSGAIVSPQKRRIGLISVDKNGKLDDPELLEYLNARGRGGLMLEYDRKKVQDSTDTMRTLGILVKEESGQSSMKNFKCVDLVNRNRADKNYTAGKFFSIGGQPLRQADADLMETMSLLLDNKFTGYHALKNAYRFLHRDQVDFFVGFPEAANIFFREASQRVIAMVYSDIVSYSTITKDKDPKETINLAKEWTLRAKEMILKYGVFFDNVIGDCVVALGGPPFCGVSLAALEQKCIETPREKIEEVITQLIKESVPKPHVYAYNATLYCLESMQVVQEYSIDNKPLMLSAGISVGPVAIGDLTGDAGRITAIGQFMNLGARLQHEAKSGQILVNEECAKQLEIYAKESYLPELPFDVIEKGEQEFKGCGVHKFYLVQPNALTSEAFEKSNHPDNHFNRPRK